MKLFEATSFLDLVITAVQASDIAQRATSLMRRQSKLVYGKYEDGAWHWSDVQTPEHTHRALIYAHQALKPYREDEIKAYQY